MGTFKGQYCGDIPRLRGLDAELYECDKSPYKVFAKFVDQSMDEGKYWIKYNKSDFSFTWQEWFGRP